MVDTDDNCDCDLERLLVLRLWLRPIGDGGGGGGDDDDKGNSFSDGRLLLVLDDAFGLSVMLLLRCGLDCCVVSSSTANKLVLLRGALKLLLRFFLAATAPAAAPAPTAMGTNASGAISPSSFFSSSSFSSSLLLGARGSGGGAGVAFICFCSIAINCVKGAGLCVAKVSCCRATSRGVWCL